MPVINSVALKGIENKVIPFNVGKITDALYSGKGSSIVINIQDLHSHEETQKNISTILSILDKKFGLERVYVEGAYGQINTKWLSSIKDKKIKNEILSNMLESGRLTGSEYYAVESGRDNVLEGIEDKRTYVDNLKRLKEIYEKKAEIESYIPNIRYILEKKAEIYYSQSNRKLNRIIKNNKEGKISSERYFRYLMQSGMKAGIDLRRYRGLVSFLQVLEKQRKIKAEKINEEINNLMQELKGQISYDQYRQLTSKIGEKATETEFYFELLKVAESKGLMGQSRYRNINIFLEYLILSQSINPIELTYEEKGLTREIHNRFAVNEFESEIYFLKEYVSYMEGYLNNKLTADEYEYFVANMGTFKLLWKKYVDVDGIIEIGRYFELFDKFYTENVERNRYFIKNVMGIMPEVAKEGIRIKANIDHQGRVLEEINNKKDIKVVITGGFHTYGFTKLLEDEGISYIVVTPNVTESAVTAEQKYEEIFRQQSGVLYETLQKMFVSSVGKGAVLNSDVLKAVSGNKNMLSILNQMLSDMSSDIKLTAFNKTENGFVFITEDGKKINVADDKTLDIKKSEPVPEKDLYKTFFVFQQMQNLNKKIRQGQRENKLISEIIAPKELKELSDNIDEVSNDDIRNNLKNKFNEIISQYNNVKKQIDGTDANQELVEKYGFGMNEALEQARFAEKSRSWLVSFIQPPVGAYMVSRNGVEGRAFNYTDSLLHAETFTIINFLENYISQSDISKEKKEELILLLDKIKVNGKNLNGIIFKGNELVKDLTIDYENKTIEDLFNETNVIFKYIDDVLGNPINSALIFCTLAPCNKCAETLIELKFKSIIFGSYSVNKTHQSYEKLHTNGTEIISGVLKKETDEYIDNYRIMNSSMFKTYIASLIQNIRRGFLPFFDIFKKDKNNEFKNIQSEELPSVSKSLDNLGITQQNHKIIRATTVAILESPYIFVSSLNEKFKAWFLRQHSSDYQDIRKAGLERIIWIVRISTLISVVAVALTSFGIIPAVSITIALVQWVLSLIVPHVVWNITHPQARLEKIARGEMKNYDVYRRGLLVEKGKRSTSEKNVINRTAYTLSDGKLWEKEQIEYELTAKESQYQETVAPEITASYQIKNTPLSASNGILFKVIIPGINDKLPTEYQQTYAHSPKGAVANILFKIFKAIKDGQLTNGRYVNIQYVMNVEDDSKDYNTIGDDTSDDAVSDSNIIKILGVILKDYALHSIIQDYRGSSTPERTDAPVERSIKKEFQAYKVAVFGLNKNKDLEVYQEVYASNPEEAIKNAVRELVFAKERGELVNGWYSDIAINRKNIDKISNAIYEKYKDKIESIVTEIPEVTKITEDAKLPKIKKEPEPEEIGTSKALYPEITQNIKYKFTVSIPIPETNRVFNNAVEAYSPKQALFIALLRYYKNREKALEAERAFWENYDIKTLSGMLNCDMNVQPFVISKSEYAPEQKTGEKEYIVTIPGLNNTKELVQYRKVYASGIQDAVNKAVAELALAKERGELSAGWYGGISISKDKVKDISEQIYKDYPSNIENFVLEIKQKPATKHENEITMQEIIEVQKIINWQDLSVSDLPRLKALLEKIGAWDYKLARAGMMYVIENKIMPSIDKDGKIIFQDEQGNIFNYWISKDGQFDASRVYFEKMGKLSRVLNIADMDENIAPRAKVMDARMKNIFSKLHLYDIGKPVIVTGAMFYRLKSRIDDIPPVIRDLIDQIFVVSGREKVNFDGNNWEFDDNYLDNFSKARMIKYDKKMIKEAFYDDIEVPWHNLFIEFANDLQVLFYTNRRPSYNDFVNAAVKQEYNDDIEYIVKILNLKDRQELFKLFDTKKRKEIKNIINIIYKETKVNETKDKLLKTMRLVSLLELIRVYRSNIEEDFSEKDYIMSEAFKREPMVANEERTTYIVTQIRPMAVRDCLVDYCSDVILQKGLEHFSIRAGGKSTIDFFKNNTNKAIAIEYLAQRFHIPSERIMYSGDELFAGVDACVVELKHDKSKKFGKLVIINSGRDDVEGTILLHNIYPNISGIAANTLMFESISDFINQNIGQIATDSNFQPTNIIQDLKNIENEYKHIEDAIKLEAENKAADMKAVNLIAENVKKIILFLQLTAINLIYKDGTSYTIIADVTDIKKTELAQYLAENGVKVNLILKGQSNLITENKRGLEDGFALIERDGNLTKYGYEQIITTVPEEQILKELIEDVAQEDMSKNKIIDVSNSEIVGLDMQGLKDMFEKNGAKTVVGIGENSNVLFMELLEKVKMEIEPVSSVMSSKPLVSVNINEDKLAEYNDRQYLQMKKREGVESIVISVNNKVLDNNSDTIASLLNLSHEEGLKIEFQYLVTSQKELELLTGHINKRIRNYRMRGVGIDGLRLDLSKLVYTGTVKKELIKLKMIVNKQNLNSLFVVELYDIPQELQSDYSQLVNNLGIIPMKAVDKITDRDDLTKTIIKLIIDRKTNTVFNIKSILDLNPSMIQISSDLLDEIIKADDNFLNTTLQKVSAVLNYVYDVSPQGMYNKGLQTGRRTANSLKLSAKDMEELYELLKMARTGQNEIFESEIFQKSYINKKNINEVQGLLQGILETAEYNRYLSSDNKTLNFVNPQFKYVFASALVENKILGNVSRDGQNITNDFIREQIRIAEALSVTADKSSAMQYYSNINTAINILNGIKSMDTGLVTERERAVAVSLLLELMPMAEQYVQLSLLDDENSEKDISKITKALLASA
ncbi:MAG: hypothetical protein PHR82_07455 [Endomicrobiaceae bacterium]|nr:hypothetical protein [Endomicrobiaceae bacterium]